MIMRSVIYYRGEKSLKLQGKTILNSALRFAPHYEAHTEHKSTIDLFGKPFIQPKQVPPLRKAAKTKLVSRTDKEGGHVNQ
jgi:hypothetical protein